MKALSNAEPVQDVQAQPGELFYLSLTQHIGAPAKALVQKGQEVTEGEVIAEAGGFVSAKIHAPVSGKVVDVDFVSWPMSFRAPCIIIEAGESREPLKITGESLIEKVASAGIVGMGGAMFPSHVKLTPKEKIDTLIINGAECEPFLTCDHRQMLERPAELVAGALAISEALNIEKVVIAVESNKKDAAQALEKAAEGRLEVRLLPQIYPQGGEKQLIQSVTGRQVPEGKLPAATGVLVHNVSTTLTIYDALTTGAPLIRRVVTVTGDVAKPGNFRVPLGMPISKLIELAGGATGEIEQVILGGPMTGAAAPSLDVPVYKGMNGIVVRSKMPRLAEQRACIRCGRCVRACPVGLSPVTLENFASQKMYAKLKEWKLLSCIECSACNYVCPSARPLKTLFRLAKVHSQ
jgi:electron transport complex protein RnfC